MERGRQRSSTAGGVEEYKARDPRPAAVPTGNTRGGGPRVDFEGDDSGRYADVAVTERGRRDNSTEDGRVLAGGTGGGRVPGNGGSGGRNAGIDGYDGNYGRGSAGSGRGRGNDLRRRGVDGRTTTFAGVRNDVHGAVIDAEVKPRPGASSKPDNSEQQHQSHSTTGGQSGDCSKSGAVRQRDVAPPAAPSAQAAAAAAMTAMTAGGPGAAGVRTVYPRQQRTWYGWGGGRKVEVRTLDVSKASVAPAQEKEHRPIVVAPIAKRPGVERPRAVAGVASVAMSGVDRTETSSQACAEPSKDNGGDGRRKTGHSEERGFVDVVVGCEVEAPARDREAGNDADDEVAATSTTSPGADTGSGSDEGVTLRGAKTPEKQTSGQRGDGQETDKQGIKHENSSKGNVTRPTAAPTVAGGGVGGGGGGAMKSPGGGQRGVSSVISVGVDKSPGRQRIVCPVVRAARTRDTVRQWRHLFLP